MNLWAEQRGGSLKLMEERTREEEVGQGNTMNRVSRLVVKSDLHF
jgi:hypothetical protein